MNPEIKRCDFGINGGSEYLHCPKPAEFITNTGYMSCEYHAPRTDGIIENRCSLLTISSRTEPETTVT
jgi:hypothetical protein